MTAVDALSSSHAFGNPPAAFAPLTLRRSEESEGMEHSFEFFTIPKGDTGKTSCDIERAIIEHWSGCDVVSTDFSVHVLLVDQFPLAAVWFNYEDGKNAVTRDVRMHKVYTHAPFREFGLAAYVFYDFCRTVHAKGYNRVVADPSRDREHLPFLVVGLRFEEPEHIGCECDKDEEDEEEDDEEEVDDSDSDFSEDEVERASSGRKRKAGDFYTIFHERRPEKKLRPCYGRDVQLRLSSELIENELLRDFADDFDDPIPPSCFDNEHPKQAAAAEQMAIEMEKLLFGDAIGMGVMDLKLLLAKNN